MKKFTQLILPIESILDDNYFVNSQGILEERDPYCKHCGAKKFSRKGYNWRLLYLEDGTPIRIKVKRYKCKKCKRKFQVEFTENWGKFCNFSIELPRLCRSRGFLDLFFCATCLFGVF